MDIGSKVKIKELGEDWANWARGTLPGKLGTVESSRTSPFTGEPQYCVTFDEPAVDGKFVYAHFHFSARELEEVPR